MGTIASGDQFISVPGGDGAGGVIIDNSEMRRNGGAAVGQVCAGYRRAPTPLSGASDSADESAPVGFRRFLPIRLGIQRRRAALRFTWKRSL